MTRTGIRPGSARLSGIMSDPVSVMTRNWTDCVLWSILYRSIYYTLISIHFSSRTPLSFHFRDFGPLKLANFDLNFMGEGEALVEIWPYMFKIQSLSFPKIKTDFNLLYSFSRYRRLKKCTFSKMVEIYPKFRLFFVNLVPLFWKNFHKNHIQSGSWWKTTYVKR